MHKIILILCDIKNKHLFIFHSVHVSSSSVNRFKVYEEIEDTMNLHRQLSVQMSVYLIVRLDNDFKYETRLGHEWDKK